MKKQVVLMILDGWGINPKKENNAIELAKTPNYHNYWNSYPHTKLKASGEAAGLPEGFQGNSEVGHLNIGAGRVVYQSLVKINKDIENKNFFKNKKFLEAINNCKKNNSNLHIMGLVQDQGVHAITTHCIALLELCKKQNFDRVFVHAFTDGRDTPPKSAAKYLDELQKGIEKNTGKIVSICGRYYAMDRDKRWDRTELAYNMLVNGIGEKSKDYKNAIKMAYDKNENDEFIKPIFLEGFIPINNKDSVIFFNYRLDRARQLTHAFLDENFKEFPRTKKEILFVSFTEYYEELKKIKNARIAFEEINMKNLFGEILSNQGLKQLRTAETEKYAHVTFFFNGKNEEPFKNEDRILIPSPKVATYDLKPEMSAYEVKEVVIDAIKNKDYDVIIVNFANGDMVGHTGDIKAAIKGCNTVDKCIKEIVDEIQKKKGIVIITSDHGNCDDMGGELQTSHTLNDVPLIIIGYDCKLKDGGILADIAPTILDIFSIKKPKEMTGTSLIEKK